MSVPTRLLFVALLLVVLFAIGCTRSHDEIVSPLDSSEATARTATAVRRQVWMITAGNCAPCERWKRRYLDPLRAAGWSVGEAADSQFRIVDVEKAGQVFPQLRDAWAPHFVYLENGTIIREAERGKGANFSMQDLRRLIADPAR